MARPDPNVIQISGAREHNLRSVSLTLPKNRLICFTGVSGSGKSSLAFDTLYAEGQRRYIESLSSYARQFMGELPKPDVDQISGLAPSISIQQKTSGWNPRSTVGTITQIHDYLRVLFARAGKAHCPDCGRPITSQAREQMLEGLMALDDGASLTMLAPVVRGQKGEYKDLFDDLVRRGFVRARVDGDVIDLASPPQLDRYRRHDIEVVVDRVVVKPGARARLAEAIELALEVGEGAAIAWAFEEPKGRTRAPFSKRAKPAPNAGREILLSSGYACTHCCLGFEQPSPQMFSFNSPRGMCADCDGLGARFDFDPELLVPDDSLSFFAPCIIAMRKPPGRWRSHVYQGVADHFGIDLHKPWRKLSQEARQTLLYGAGDTHITFEWRGRRGAWKHGGTFDGVIAELRAQHKKSASAMVRAFYEKYMRQTVCQRCTGARLNPQALAVTFRSTMGGNNVETNIDGVCKLPINQALAFFDALELDDSSARIAEEPLKEIRARLRFLADVGLEYLTLDRAAPTLSGGESQRIRLASQIGCGLVGVLYVLDEPSIGLHPRDNRRLLASLTRLRDMGNTVIVVEHDRDTMEVADHIVDFGPGPGVRGGEVAAQGKLSDVTAAADSLTGQYLSGRRRIETPATRRPVNPPSRRKAQKKKR